MPKKQYSFRLEEHVIECVSEITNPRFTITDFVDMAIKYLLVLEDDKAGEFEKIIGKYFNGELDSYFRK